MLPHARRGHILFLVFSFEFLGMYIASAKRKENIAEYLLYMWQIEDIIRANSLDIELVKRNVIDKIPEPRREGETRTHRLVRVAHRYDAPRGSDGPGAPANE